MGPPDGHERTLLVVYRLCGGGHCRNGVVVPSSVSIDVVVDPGRRGLGVGSPVAVVDLVPKGRVTRVPVESLRSVQLARATSGGVVSLVASASVEVLHGALLLLFGSKALLLLLKPRGTAEKIIGMISYDAPFNVAIILRA